MKQIVFGGLLLLLYAGCGTIRDEPIRLERSGPAILTGTVAIAPADLASAFPAPLPRQRMQEKVSPVTDSDWRDWARFAVSIRSEQEICPSMTEVEYMQTYDFSAFARYLKLRKQLAERRAAVINFARVGNIMPEDSRLRQFLGYVRLQCAVDTTQGQLRRIVSDVRAEMRRAK